MSYRGEGGDKTEAETCPLCGREIYNQRRAAHFQECPER